MTEPDRPPRWTEYMPLTDVLRAERNPRSHATRIIRDSLRRFGIVELPALDERTGRLVAGHGRLDQWQHAHDTGAEPPDGVVITDGVWTVPVNRGWSSTNDDEAAAYLITSNTSAALGGWDEDALDGMLTDIASRDYGLAQITGTSDADLTALLEAVEREPDDLPPLGELIERENPAGYADPYTEAPWMAQTAPRYTPPDGSALAAAHAANHPDPEPETPEQAQARTDRITTHRKITSGELVEVTLIYTPDDKAEAARLIAAARHILGTGIKGSEIILRALRVMMAALDHRDDPTPVNLGALARHAGWEPEPPASTSAAEPANP